MAGKVDRMARPRWKRLGIGAFKLVIAAVVLWSVGRHISRSWEALGRHGRPLRFEPVWLAVSGVLYLAGLSLCGEFFHQVMWASPSPLRRYPAIRAYLVSHLGKYVPGKAMVVVIRAGMSVPYGARGITAAVATFYETLVMMAAGGLIAAIGFGATSTDSETVITLDAPVGWDRLGAILSQIPMFAFCAGIGLVLGFAFLLIVLPPVFRRLTHLITTPFGGVGAETSPRVSARLLGWGLFWSTLCWIFLGLSQIAVVCAISPIGGSGAVRLAPLAIASVAIATVAGFIVAVLPGGLGVREGVLMVALGPAISDGAAVAAAILLRLVWIAAELIAGAALVAIRPRPVRAPAPPSSVDGHELPAESAPAEMGQRLS
jgi:hypothetical protein